MVSFAVIQSPPTPALKPPPYSSVQLPADYQTNFLHYATVQRPDGTVRNLYVSPNAVDTLSTGNFTLPDHTIIAIDGYYAQQDADGQYLTSSDGQYLAGQPFEMIHVLEKRDDWTISDFAVENRIGQWNFGSFAANKTGEHFDENITDCFNCHNATAQTDFLYSAPLLTRYARTQLIQYMFCDLPNRLAC